MSDVFGATILAVLLVALGGVVAWEASHRAATRDFIRDCSMTRVHIIDDNTLISCTVLKVNRTETPVQDSKKPEISL